MSSATVYADRSADTQDVFVGAVDPGRDVPGQATRSRSRSWTPVGRSGGPGPVGRLDRRGGH